MKTSLGKAVYLTIQATLDATESLSRNGLDIPEETAAKSIASDEFLSFADLFDYLPAAKSLGEDEELSEELAEIQQDYEDAILSLVPDYSAAEEAGLLTINEETGEIIVSDDSSIDLNSMEGIALVEVNNLIAGGMTTEEAVLYVQDDINKLLSEFDEENEAKGVYIPQNLATFGPFVCGGRWENNTVKYWFEDRGTEHVLSAEGKKLVREAMDDWTKKMGGKIKFKEIERNFNQAVASGFFQYPYVTIKKEAMSNYRGLSTIGSFNHGIGYLKINEQSLLEYKKDNGYESFRKEYLQTAKHELGHTLGLYHEHQRPDRDKYVEISNGGELGYEKIPEKQVCAGVTVIKVWFIRIYIPYIWYKQIAYKVGSFDFDSIMLYEGLRIKAPYANKKNGKLIDEYANYYDTRENYEISKTDVETIKRMYLL